IGDGQAFLSVDVIEREGPGLTAGGGVMAKSQPQARRQGPGQSRCEGDAFRAREKRFVESVCSGQQTHNLLLDRNPGSPTNYPERSASVLNGLHHFHACDKNAATLRQRLSNATLNHYD